MAKGKTETGFKFEVKDNIVEDYELIEMIAEVDENPLVTPKLLNKLLGTEQVKALKDHIREDDGTVNVYKMLAEVKAIFDSLSESKK
ncbi:hypothetical protein [Globicatella sanguinis]|uniref:hypothetical protein n=1 Tax=Globicatella sanguinis TaxID=13076 RepID=UPI00082693D9|nr:hypothetical protein [Globicatella sanguinis]